TLVGDKWLIHNFVTQIDSLRNHAQWVHGPSEKATDHKDKARYRAIAIAAERMLLAQLTLVFQTEAIVRALKAAGETSEPGSAEADSRQDVFEQAYTQRMRALLALDDAATIHVGKIRHNDRCVNSSTRSTTAGPREGKTWLGS